MSLLRPNLRRQRIPRRGEARDVSLPSPVGGWNQRDALDNMDPLDAIVMDNIYPDIGKVTLRNGFAVHSDTTEDTFEIETLAELFHGTTRKLNAAVNGKIYDVTTDTPAVAASGPFTVSKWQTVNFSGAGVWVNGTDHCQITTNGTSFAETTAFTGGLADTEPIGVFSHQGRLFYWKDNDQNFWYQDATNTVGGAVSEFPLKNIGSLGGNLVCAGSWNVEGGSDVWGGGGIGNDLAVFVMSSGEAIVYEGEAPAAGLNWHLVGVYQIGEPVDVRAIQKIGGDLTVLTREGLVSMTEVVSAKRFDRRGVITDKISEAIINAVIDNASTEGWDVIYYPTNRHYMFINVPQGSSVYHQYVMNLRTGAWCRFKDQNGRAWARFNNGLYFGGANGIVYQADTGTTDNPEGVAADIRGDVVQAYNEFGAPGVVKSVRAMNPVLEAIGSISFSMAPKFDFVNPLLAAGELTFTPEALNWDNIEELWEDWEVLWGTGQGSAVVSNWILTQGQGYKLAACIRVDASSEFTWHSTTWKIAIGQGMT